MIARFIVIAALLLFAVTTAPLASLTARELQIVRLVCLGCVNKQIADRLRISEYTVKTYLKQIFCKLNVHSRSAMVFRCASHGFPSVPSSDR